MMRPHTVNAAGLTLVRGGSEADVARLVSIGGRVLATGAHISVKEWPDATLDVPYALVAVGKLRVLVALDTPGRQAGDVERQERETRPHAHKALAGFSDAHRGNSCPSGARVWT
ncbi:MAG TPA: hypothetical protein VKQ36_01430 [Ktedonobacterales bacterium]|nr:hypothetical protein [Ktedonobacterales bacterium]